MGGARGELLGPDDADRAHLEPDAVEALEPADRRMDRGPVCEHRHERIRAAPRAGRRVRHARALDGLGLLARAVPDGELVARRDDVAGQARAHDPRPEQPDLHRLESTVDPTNVVILLSIVVPLLALAAVCWVFWAHRHDD